MLSVKYIKAFDLAKSLVLNDGTFKRQSRLQQTTFIYIFFFFLMFVVNPLLGRIHMKNQILFSSKDESKKLKCCLLQFLLGASRVKVNREP